MPAAKSQIFANKKWNVFGTNTTLAKSNLLNDNRKKNPLWFPGVVFKALSFGMQISLRRNLNV
jgi:hypothetical protein